MTNAITAPASSLAAAAAAPVKPDKLVADKDTFLKLLVAQLKNQNPLDPADGIQFVTQLAQFTTLEHSATMSEDLAAIRAALETQTAEPTAATETSQEQ